MSPKTRDAERTKAAILEASRRLFAERAISSVSIRDIAEEAGVSHGLVQHHFGTRDQLVGAVIRDEIERFASAPDVLPGGSGLGDPEALRRELKAGLTRFKDFALVIARAELEGAAPETLLDPDVPTPATLLARAIRELQAEAKPGSDLPDPDLISACVNAMLFAFATMTPWLMRSVGLEPRDYEARLDEIIDVIISLIALASGPPQEG
jgi:AcrR family transcriptional regulator